MKFKTIKTFAAAIILIPVLATAQVTVEWVDYSQGVGIATDNSNNVYTAYYDYNPAGDIYLTKRNSAGVVQWTAKYDQTDNSKWEKATWVQSDQQGNIIVSGTLMSGYSNPVNAASIVMKFSPAGTLLWRVVYENSFDGSYTQKCLIDKANNIYVLGMGSGPGGFVTKVKKFDSNGNSLWNYFDNAGIGAAQNFKFTPDSNLVIVSRSIFGSINGYAKIDRNGNNIWSFAGVNSLTAGDISGDALGNTFLVHGIYQSGVTGSTLKKLSPNGALLWSKDFTNLSAFRVETGSDNNPVMSGYPVPGSGGAAFLKTDPNGNQLWFNADADSIYNFLSHAMMRTDAQNNIYLAAGIMTNMGMCKVNSNGTNAWAIVFGTGYSQAFTLGTDNHVYVTGGATAKLVQPSPPVSCNLPVNLSVSNITATSARVNWTAIPGVIRYHVFYKKSNETTWTKKYINGSKSFTVLNNLECGRQYKWKIRTLCDTVGPDIISAFSPVQSFNTLSCRLADDSQNAQAAYDFQVYPNPVHDILKVRSSDLSDETAEVHIYNLMGIHIYSGIIYSNREFAVDVSALQSGVYQLKITSGTMNKCVRFVKQ
ncbi:MAG: T9SS type A sorting domain-containing protein [Bacteroidia bacterium]|nr:T9SS type A sorting domain-containing protein [Bacteroidia bacterium]